MGQCTWIADKYKGYCILDLEEAGEKKLQYEQALEPNITQESQAAVRSWPPENKHPLRGKNTSMNMQIDSTY